MQALETADVVLVRYGDIATKSDGVRRSMVDTLLANLRWGLDEADIDATVERTWTRPIVHPPPEAIDAATAVATRTPGVVSASPAIQRPPQRAAILDAVETIAAGGLEGATFAIRARRSAKDHPFTSADLEREAGSLVLETTEKDLTVDLDEPATTIHVEVREDRAFVFTDVVDGPGGLPVGTQAPLVALISGGIDSPVAAHAAMCRGAPIVPVYVELGPYSGPDHRARALESIAALVPVAAGEARPARVVPGGEAVRTFVAAIDRGRMLVLRRFMFRMADHLAERVNAAGIVTGEALGQKSSQTARNLQATGAGIDHPIHRPLLSLDKATITERAKAIGTYRSATIDAGCPSIAPDRVATHASVAEVDDLEPPSMDRLVANAVDDAEVVPLEALAAYR